ncbi:hypothetical protein PQ465_13455 [Sphingobacterium oryzagri]|uniref:DUF4369 domain-containing protein n=1 Tax=Sphingobacterium oryzagri TaxID=3025669 RepID=A0ABY7WCB8_9SPHI|nr:hypothetical protein [Sphingobacterium sp. KACC 22765]WDF67311.1 hypothetical protein PQ465_13455 [Sphingobacterium sp. KACC 22765]
MKYTRLLVALLIFTVGCASAQTTNDFFITTKQDTVYGELRSYKEGRIKFKIDGKNQKLDPHKTYRVYEAKENRWYAPSYIENCIVRIEGSQPKMYRISESRRKTAKPLFAEVITDGAIVVYAFEKKQMMGREVIMVGAYGGPITHYSRRIYALKRATNEIVELKKTGPVLYIRVNSTKIKNDQSNLFADFPELVEEIAKQPSINYDYMLECINRYNQQKQLMGEGLAVYGMEIY